VAPPAEKPPPICLVRLDSRPLGSTGRTVTRLGLGLAALGRPQYINLDRDADLGADRSVAAMEARCRAVLDAAYAAGVRYVDAARSYGLAESFLGRWLRARQIPLGVLTVGSKWGYRYVAGWQADARVHEVKDLSLEHLRTQWAESREHLGPWLAVYQIHSATVESGVLDDVRVLAELAALASSGVTIGLTVSGPSQAATIRRAFDVIVDGVNPFRSVQATWNLLERSAGDALADAHARGWGVIVKEALANGRLRDRAHEAIASAAAQPWADVVLSGAVTEEQLRDSIATVSAADRIGDEGLASVTPEPPEVYWATRAQLPWA